MADKYTAGIKNGEHVVLLDGVAISMRYVLELLNAATPPADAALAEYCERAARNWTKGCDMYIGLMCAAAALRARPQAVAEGFVMVPVEPTEAMLSVAVDNWSGYEEESGRFYTPLDSDVRILWKAMLAASQSATGGAT